MEIWDKDFMVPWLVAYTEPGDTTQRDASQKASEKAKIKRALSACRHAGGMNDAKHAPFAQSRARLARRKRGPCWFPNIRPNTTPPFRCRHRKRHRDRGKMCSPVAPDEEYAPQVLFDAIRSRSALYSYPMGHPWVWFSLQC